MRTFTPIEVLTILAQRLEDRAAALERVCLPGYSVTIEELRKFAAMIRKARQYLGDTSGRQLEDGVSGAEDVSSRHLKS